MKKRARYSAGQELTMALKKGDEVELTIESAAYQGKGVAKVDGMAVFVPSVAPGDRILARIIKRKKNYREAKLLEILEPSPNRIEPRCRHAKVCGGCTWQHIPYDDQLSIKEQHVRDHIQRIAGLDPDIVRSVIGCEQEFYYRNKMEYSFGTRRWLTEEEISRDSYVDDSGFVAGLHAPGRYDKILDLKECHLQHPVSFNILDAVRTYCLERKISAYDTINNRGYLRHLVIRNSHATDDLMVNFVTYSDDTDVIEGMTGHLLDSFPEITTIVNNINDQPNPTAVGRYERILYGPGTIRDNIGPYQFNIDANAFFQTNTQQAFRLYSVARDFLEPEKHPFLFDLYCGVGTIALFMSDAAEQVTGIEISDVAIRNARRNAVDNGITNVRFLKGDMKDIFSDELLEGQKRPDAVITDPPRSGMHPDVVSRLLNLRSKRVIYVSCNPSTMARDLKELKQAYTVDAVQPVDMFPQTWHIEAVARLSLKTSQG